MPYTVPCFHCNQPVNTDDPSAFRRVIGWERKAVSQSRKGGSDIVLREQTDDYSCFACVERLKMGVNVAQSSLL